jgi:hypothetical protein
MTPVVVWELCPPSDATDVKVDALAELFTVTEGD